jgi:hypothetical protein
MFNLIGERAVCKLFLNMFRKLPFEVCFREPDLSILEKQQDLLLLSLCFGCAGAAAACRM